MKTPFMGVTEADRSVRFFPRSEGIAAALRATVVYKTPNGNPRRR